MNIVQSGTMYMIYDDSVKTYSELPVGAYEVGFNKMTGFFLKTRNDFKVTEKVYGNHAEKVDKVLKSFQLADRNFGLILSGQKGIGKSMFMRVLAEKAGALGYPVVVVSDYIPGIDDFLASIEQECVVLFDEFEKTFRQDDDHHEPQEEMLSLFDGIDGGKKLFIITCNEVRKLNAYLLDRPGRFHYHFEILPPKAEEVREYMIDNLNPEYWDEIENIVTLANSIYMTYDYLRAITFELNQGYTLAETLADLNIARTDTDFDIVYIAVNGMEFKAPAYRLDVFSDREECLRAWGFSKNTNLPSSVWFTINPSHIITENGEMTYPVDLINIDQLIDEDYYYDIEDAEEQKRLIALAKQALAPKKIIFKKIDRSFVQKYMI